MFKGSLFSTSALRFVICVLFDDSLCDKCEALSLFYFDLHFSWGFPGSPGKESTCQVGSMGLMPGLGRSPGEGNGNPFQYSCLGNPMVRGAWRTSVHGVTEESDTTATKPLPPMISACWPSVISMSSLEKRLFRSSAHFLNWVFFFDTE